MAKEKRVRTICAGCGDNILEGEGWRRLPDPEGGWLEYHHFEKREPSGEYNRAGVELADITVIKTCTPKPAKAAAR